MARKAKEGLEYYPHDVDMYSDDKVKLLRARLGIKGYAVYTLLLAKIYRTNGYWMPWGEDEALLFSNDVGGECQHSFVNDVVHESVKRGLFDADIFDKFKILTSKGIQERYSLVVNLSKLKRPDIDAKIDCRNISKLRKIIPSGFFDKSSEENAKTSEEIDKNPEESTQRKGKERKEKEIENFAPQHSSFLEKLFRPEQKLDIENIEFLLRRFGIKQEWAKQFNAYLHTNGKEHLQYTDWRSHFANWLKVQKPEFFTPIGTIGFNAVPIKKPKGTLGQN